MTSPSAFDAQSLSLIDRLKCFNAKERYWVVRHALGQFHPSDAFMREAANAAGVPAPGESAHSAVYLAMDYHLNWLHAALGEGQVGHAEKHNPSIGDTPNPSIDDKSSRGGEPKQRFRVENSQEDVDLLLAYLRPDGWTQLILVEAKCTGGFTLEQLESKAIRLCGIAGSDRLAERRVDIKLVLLSPEGLQRAETVQGRIRELRTFCNDRGAADLIPADGKGWLPLEVRPLDPEGFWVVKPGSVAGGTWTLNHR